MSETVVSKISPLSERHHTVGYAPFVVARGTHKFQSPILFDFVIKRWETLWSLGSSFLPHCQHRLRFFCRPKESILQPQAWGKGSGNEWKSPVIVGLLMRLVKCKGPRNEERSASMVLMRLDDCKGPRKQGKSTIILVIRLHNFKDTKLTSSTATITWFAVESVISIVVYCFLLFGQLPISNKEVPWTCLCLPTSNNMRSRSTT